MAQQIETFALALSDLHIGKKTETYNIHIANEMIQRLCLTLLRVKELLSGGYEFDEFVLFLLGDMLDGDGIYPGQPHFQDVSALTAQASVGASMLLRVVQTGLEIAPTVRVIAVPGNHGRSGKHAHTASNWDLVLYQQMQIASELRFGERVTYEMNAPNIVNEEDEFSLRMPDLLWMRVAQVKGHYFLLHHGHATRRVLGIPYYSLLKRAYYWRTSVREPWEVILSGHFHQFAWLEENGFVCLLNGTMVKDDTWALETLGVRGVNRTWAFGVSEHRAITWSYGLELV